MHKRRGQKTKKQRKSCRKAQAQPTGALLVFLFTLFMILYYLLVEFVKNAR